MSLDQFRGLCVGCNRPIRDAHPTIEDHIACEVADHCRALAEIHAIANAERRAAAERRRLAKRFVVRSTQQSYIRTIREPHHVIDTTTNSTIDSYSTKRAATMHAAYLNRYEGNSK